MTIKSYFADSVAAAMREARKELGDEAMLLKSRRAAHDFEHLGRYEVVFGVAAASSTSAELAAEASAWADADRNGGQAAPVAPAPEPREVAAGPAEAPETQKPAVRSVEQFQQRLIEAEVDPRLVLELVSAIRARLREASAADGQAPGEDRLLAVIAQEAERILPTGSTSQSDATAGAAVLFGPPGAGKTSAIVRLAVSQGLARSRRVVVLAASDFRIGGLERLKYFCNLLDVEFHALNGPEELGRRLDSRRDDEMILIDTPGFGPNDMSHSASLVACLGPRRDVQRHFVLPATLKQADLRSTVNRFELFRANWLLFTRVDEASKLGPIFSEAALSRRPISFVTTGQQVPGDIAPASEFSLLGLIGKRDDRMLSAA